MIINHNVDAAPAAAADESRNRTQRNPLMTRISANKNQIHSRPFASLADELEIRKTEE